MPLSGNTLEGALPPKLARLHARKLCAKCGEGHSEGSFYMVGYARTDSQMWGGDYVTTTTLGGTCAVFLCDDCVGNGLPSQTASGADVAGCLLVLAGVVAVASVVVVAFARRDIRPDLSAGGALIWLAIGAVVFAAGLIVVRRQPKREPIKPRDRVKRDPEGAKSEGERLAVKIAKPLARDGGYNVVVNHDRYESMMAEAERQEKRRDA